MYVTARDGTYKKPEGEDLASIALGISGFKGEVHVAFGTPVQGEFRTSEELATHFDHIIVGNLKVFPTQVLALDGQAELAPRVRKAFDKILESCPPEHREFVILQYANQLKNKRAIIGRI